MIDEDTADIQVDQVFQVVVCHFSHESKLPKIGDLARPRYDCVRHCGVKPKYYLSGTSSWHNGGTLYIDNYSTRLLAENTPL